MQNKNIIKLVCQKDDEGLRLDYFLFKKILKIKKNNIFSRSRIQSLIKDGNVLVNEKIIKIPSIKTKEFHTYIIHIPKNKNSIPKGQKIPLNILYEDKDLIVINKPIGMVVHPGAGNKDNTLVNALLNHCGKTLSGIGGIIRPGIVHRIDKDTSGIMVSAKNDISHINLSEQFKNHTINRSYYALVWGNPIKNKGEILDPIGRHPYNRIKMSINSRGKHAKTKWEVIKRFYGLAALVKCNLATGRTHQIRVHLSSIGHWIVGDKIYKSKKNIPYDGLANSLDLLKNFNRQALHAFQLGFIHPTNMKKLNFNISIAEDMQILIDNLEKNI